MTVKSCGICLSQLDAGNKGLEKDNNKCCLFHHWEIGLCNCAWQPEQRELGTRYTASGQIECEVAIAQGIS